MARKENARRSIRSGIRELRLEQLEVRYLLTALIRSPVSVLQNTGGDASAEFDIGQTIDQSGLSSGFSSGVTEFDSYLATNPTHTIIAADFEWFTPLHVNSSTIEYDMGGSYLIDRLAMWNEEAAGIATLHVYTSNDQSTWKDVGSFSPTNNPASLDYKAEVFDIEDTNARYVLLEVTGPQSPSTHDSVSMGEIAFSTTELEQQEFTINVTTYIPSDHVPGPPQSFCLTSPSIDFETPPLVTPPLYRQLYFAGDNRGNDPNATSFRTRQLVTVITDPAVSPSGLKSGSTHNLVGTYDSYAEDALANGTIDAADDDGTTGDCTLLHETATASNSGMHIDVTRISDTVVSAHMYGGASNPLVFSAPSIDWDFTITIGTSGTDATWDIQGEWDGFPAVEVYINDQLIYANSPGPGPYSFTTDLINLFPGIGDVAVSDSGVIAAASSVRFGDEDGDVEESVLIIALDLDNHPLADYADDRLFSSNDSSSDDSLEFSTDLEDLELSTDLEHILEDLLA